MAYDETQRAVTEYVRDYILAMRRRGMTYRQIAAELGVSHVWVQQLEQPEKYGQRKVGAELEQRLSEIMHSGSVDALRRAALALMRANPGLPVIVEGAPVERREPSRRPAKKRRTG